MAAPVLQFKRGNAGVAGTVPALRPGEPAISLNNFDFFIGIDTSVANNKFFGSHRYWTRENGTNALKLNLVDKGGSSAISVKSPDTLVGAGTYTLPDPNTIVDGYFLRVATDGSLSWDTTSGIGGSFTNATLSGVTTVTGSLNATGAVVNAGIVTVTDLYLDATRVLYNDGSGITLAGIQTIDATTKSTLETILAFDPNNFTTLNVTGIATVGGLIDANGGLDVLGHTELDNANVSGIITAASVVFGSGTAITSVDTDLSSVSATDNTLASAKAIKSYVDAQVTAQDLDFAGDTGTGAVDLDSQTFTIAGTANEIETSASGQTITIGLPNNVTIGAALTVTGALDVNGGGSIDNVRIGVAGDNEIDTSTGNLTIDSAGGTTTIDDNLSVTGTATITSTLTANGNVTLGDAAGDTITVNGTATFNQSITGTISTATRATTVDITDTDAQSGGIVFGSAGTGATLYNDTDLSYNSNTNVLSVPIVSATTEVRTPAVKAADGTTAITITNTTGTVATGSDLTVGGNLYVNGSTTQVNTASMTVEDRTIELGIVDGSAPSSATTWDLGVLFNYHDGAAKKSALVWEQGDARFKLGSVVTDGGGAGNSNPQITLTTYAALEIADLWINNTCTGGSTQVIGCIGSELNLQNITVDAGQF